MARICGVNLPKDKRIVIALTYIHGIGKSVSQEILTDLNINGNTKVHALSEGDVAKLRERIDKLTTEGDLRRKVALDVKRLQDAGSYRGYRHRRRLPSRGQKTKTNARTRRGKKVTMGSGRRKETKK